MFNSNNGTLPVSIPLGVGNYGAFGGNGFDDLIALAVIGLIFGGNGWGNGFFGGNGGNSVRDAYVLGSDMSMISRQLSDGFGATESKLDSVNNGLCSLGYDQLAQMNGINTNILQSANGIQNAINSCCCTTQQNIKDTQYALATESAGVQRAIKDCCCENQMIAMQNRYDSAQQNCATLQAIDKVGDRIIDYMANEKAQTLRDENFALKLASSQEHQNNVLINTLRPSPIPAFAVPSPFYYGNYNGGFGYGTTIA